MTTDSTLSWQTTLTALVVIVGLAGSQWAMTQLQFQAVERQLLYNKEAAANSDALLRERIKVLHDASVDLQMFRAYEKGADAQVKLLVDRLNALEQTRPTTGELKAATDSLRDRIEKLYAAQSSMEDWVRTRGLLPRPPEWPAK